MPVSLPHSIHPAPPPRRRDPQRRRVVRLLLAAMALCYVFSIPWYRTPEGPLRVWLGLPDWVAVALACYVGVAVLNALAWLLVDIPDAESSSGDAS